MYERFTNRSRKVMQLANQEAQRLNHKRIGTEHILLGLVKEGSGVAANVLKNLGIDLRKIRLEIEKIVPRGPDGGQSLMGRLPFTPRARKVIDYSVEEARTLNHNYVGTEHVLLGLLREPETVAAQILMNLGLKIEDVRNEVLYLLGHNMPAPSVRPHVVVSGSPPAEPLTESQIRLIEERIRQLKDEKEELVMRQDFERAVEYRDEARALALLLEWYRWYRGQG